MNLKINENCGKLEQHVKNNLIKYILLLIIFGIGILVGGMCFYSIRNDSDSMLGIKELIEQIMNAIINERWILINEYLLKDIGKIILLIIISSSMIGLPLLLIWILYDGITLSFTIATLIYTYGITKGNLLSTLLLFIPNLTSLIAIMIATVSSVKLISNLFKMKKPLKIEIIRHIIVCMLCAGIVMAGFLWRVFSMSFTENIINI